MKDLIKSGVFCNPFFYFAIELLIIESIWGISSVSEVSIFAQAVYVIVAVIIPSVISLMVRSFIFPEKVVGK